MTLVAVVERKGEILCWRKKEVGEGNPVANHRRVEKKGFIRFLEQTRCELCEGYCSRRKVT